MKWKWRLNYETQPGAPGSAFSRTVRGLLCFTTINRARRIADLHHQGIGCLVVTMGSILVALRFEGDRHIANAVNFLNRPRNLQPSVRSTEAADGATTREQHHVG